MKAIVEIPEIHKVIIEVEVASNATEEEICAAANEKLQTRDDLHMEYSDTLDDDEYTIRDADGNYFGDKGFGK